MFYFGVVCNATRLQIMRTYSNIVFLGGIHGVGKGDLCNEIISNLDINYLSTSKLIQWAELNEDTTEKRVEDINKTQERLLRALEKNYIDGAKYLLDGHYCLLDNNSNPTRIQKDVFYKINPSIFLTLFAEPNVIKSRLEKRDNKKYDMLLIEEMQEIEINYSKELARELDKPFLLVNQENTKSTIDLIKQSL